MSFATGAKFVRKPDDTTAVEAAAAEGYRSSK